MLGKRVIAAIVSVALVVGLMPLPAYASLGVGLLEQQGESAQQIFVFPQSQATHTIEQIKAEWKALPAEPSGTSIFLETNDNASYKASTLTPAALAYAKAYLNFIRYSAGLSPIELDPTLNANAAQGALIMAAGNQFTHYPITPSTTTNALAKPGKYACATSNISYIGSYPNIPTPLRNAIQGQMDDSESSNLSTVGHRRWLLNPATSTMGIGSAYAYAAPFHKMYTAVRVFTNPTDSNYSSMYGSVGQTGSTAYDHIAWPASGNFASNLFVMGTPWSVTLNPDKYLAPSPESVQVSVTRASDNKTWTITGADSTPSNNQKYLIADNNGYGVPNCIIFNPGSDNVAASSYSGVYQVKITGLKTTSGTDTTLSYQVNFFDLEDQSASEASTSSTTANTKTPKITLQKKSKNVKLSQAKKKAQSFNIGAKSSSGGKLTYKVTVSNANITFKNGKVKLKKVKKAGTYAIQVQVTTKAKGDYKKYSKKFALSFKVKR